MPAMMISKQLVWDALSRFVKPSLLAQTAAELPSGIAVPPQWVAILQAQQASGRMEASAGWDDFSAQLPTMAAFFHKQARPLLLLADADHAVSLLYPFTAGGELYLYRGHPPLSAVPERFQSVWPRIPQQFRDFYTAVHNGWAFLSANSMGPLPVEDWACLSDDRFDIDDGSAAGMPADPGKVIAVFHNGGGDYLCLDFSAPDGVATGLIWWHDDPGHPDVVNFWAALDAWIGVFFEDVDNVQARAAV
ncbi:hypothetical protein BN2497_1013 [Janthinobacterium sp. CG23_2]|nr:SMI1/KNR4 family protein [Massilia sp. H27-R4]CUI03118.1 hypothetical protein BN2497_1013 [Janthinobacterium sp. CG23_2]CUU26904.1 hypothetical protein BN3177_1013 [Janthinobacterium sp. CG23_2]